MIRLWARCGLLRPWNDPHKDIARKKRMQRDLFLVGTVDGELVAAAMAGYDGHRGWGNYLAGDDSADHRRNRRRPGWLTLRRRPLKPSERLPTASPRNRCRSRISSRMPRPSPRSRKDARFTKLTVIGHSEGGIIAILLASGTPRPDALVLLTAPGRPLWTGRGRRGRGQRRPVVGATDQV